MFYYDNWCFRLLWLIVIVFFIIIFSILFKNIFKYNILNIIKSRLTSKVFWLSILITFMIVITTRCLLLLLFPDISLDLNRIEGILYIIWTIGVRQLIKDILQELFDNSVLTMDAGRVSDNSSNMIGNQSSSSQPSSSQPSGIGGSSSNNIISTSAPTFIIPKDYIPQGERRYTLDTIIDKLVRARTNIRINSDILINKKEVKIFLDHISETDPDFYNDILDIEGTPRWWHLRRSDKLINILKENSPNIDEGPVVYRERCDYENGRWLYIPAKDIKGQDYLDIANILYMISTEQDDSHVIDARFTANHVIDSRFTPYQKAIMLDAFNNDGQRYLHNLLNNHGTPDLSNINNSENLRKFFLRKATHYAISPLNLQSESQIIRAIKSNNNPFMTSNYSNNTTPNINNTNIDSTIIRAINESNNPFRINNTESTSSANNSRNNNTDLD